MFVSGESYQLHVRQCRIYDEGNSTLSVDPQDQLIESSLLCALLIRFLWWSEKDLCSSVRQVRTFTRTCQGFGTRSIAHHRDLKKNLNFDSFNVPCTHNRVTSYSLLLPYSSSHFSSLIFLNPRRCYFVFVEFLFAAHDKHATDLDSSSLPIEHCQCPPRFLSSSSSTNHPVARDPRLVSFKRFSLESSNATLCASRAVECLDQSPTAETPFLLPLLRRNSSIRSIKINRIYEAKLLSKLNLYGKN